MRKIIFHIHLSLDGFVAGPNSDLSYFSPSDQALAFVNNFAADANAALFGRNCYKMLNNFWPSKRDDAGATEAEIEYSNWYNAAQKIVVSSTLQNNQADDVLLISASPDVALKNIKQQPGKNIIIFGSPSLSDYLLQKGLVDEVLAFVHPVFFGKGLRLFTNLSDKANLKLIDTHIFSTSELALHYVIN